ncbi:hypothetical protein BC332_18945 [Capsicum chinense]|nr:hypothetical protein BC332_18945 [Capsicum chinense]
MSRFPYTHGLGARYALGLTYMIKQVVARNDSNVRWYIFADDDTVFIVDNLVKTLQKYDHNEWYYIGSNSESYVQNDYFSFDMAFGGGGYAVSTPLARVLARVLDSCLMRYPSLYSSDARIFSCLAELGVSLTHEPGFHQDDVWGNLFGILASHPLSPLLSLHHIDDVHSLFPKMTKIQALQHFFKAANADPARISQQYICYDRKNSLSIAVAWGYAVQVYEGDITVPELMTVLRSFESYDKNKRSPYFMFKTKVESRGPCQKMVAFLESVDSNGDNVWSNYTRHRVKGKTCKKNGNKIIKNLEEITVFSSKLDIDARQLLIGTMANEAEMPSWVKSIMARLDAINCQIMDRMEWRLEGAEGSLYKKLNNLMEHQSLFNQISVCVHAPHELQGNQTNFCTLVKEDNSQLSVNDSLSLSEPNVPLFCDDNVQLKIVDILVDQPSVESIVTSDSTLSYGSHDNQLMCENGDVEQVGRLTKDDPLVVFVVHHPSIEGICYCIGGSLGEMKHVLHPCPWIPYPFDPIDHLRWDIDSFQTIFWNDMCTLCEHDYVDAKHVLYIIQCESPSQVWAATSFGKISPQGVWTLGFEFVGISVDNNWRSLSTCHFMSSILSVMRSNMASRLVVAMVPKRKDNNEQ